MEINDMKRWLKNVKVVYTDVDGTLVNNGCLFRNKMGYTLKNAAAIHDLLNAGVDVVMTTSRTEEQLQEIARLLGFRNYISDLGCKIIYDNGERILRNYGIGVESDRDLKDWIECTGVIESLFDRYEDNVRYYVPWSNNVKTHPLLVGELDFVEVDDWVSEEFPQLRIIDNGSVPPEKDFKSPHVYHILPKNVGKKRAIEIDKEERDLKEENLVAVGDSMEDVTMADEVGVYFGFDDGVKTDRENVIYVENRDGEGFSRVVRILKDSGLI